MAVVDYFLKLDGIDAGPGTHKGEIQLDSFSWGVSNTAVTPGQPGKASAHDFDFVAKSTIASPKLMVACATGLHIKEANLTAITTGLKGTQTTLMKIRMLDVLVSSYQNSGSDAPTQPANVDDSPMDSVNLGYRSLEFTFGTVTGTMTPGAPT